MASIDIDKIKALNEAVTNPQETDKAKKIEAINAKIADLIWANYTYEINKPGSTAGEKEDKAFDANSTDDEITTLIVPKLMDGVTDTDGTLKSQLIDALKATRNALIELNKVEVTQATQEALNTSSKATDALKDAIGEDAITTLEAYKDKPRPKMTDIDPNFWWYINAIQIIVTQLGASSLLWDSKDANKSADILWPRTRAGVKTIQNYLNTTYPETKLVSDGIPGPLTINALLAPVSADDSRSRLEKMLADKKNNNLTLTPEEPIFTTSTDATSQDKDKAKVAKKSKKWENDPNGDGVDTVDDSIDGFWNKVILITNISELPNEWWPDTDKKVYRIKDNDDIEYDFYGNKRASTIKKTDSRDVIKKEIEFNNSHDEVWNQIIEITDLSQLPTAWRAVTDKKMYKFTTKDGVTYNFYGNKRAANTDTQKIDSRDVMKKEINSIETSKFYTQIRELKKWFETTNKNNKSYQELWSIIKERFVHDQDGKEHFNNLTTLKTNEYILTWLLECKEANADPTTRGGLQYILNQIWPAYTQRSDIEDVLSLYQAQKLDNMKKIAETIDPQTKKEIEEARLNFSKTKFSWITSINPKNTLTVKWKTLWAYEDWLSKSNGGYYFIEVDYSENVGEIVKDIKKGREEYKKVSKTIKKDEYK